MQMCSESSGDGVPEPPVCGKESKRVALDSIEYIQVNVNE